MTIDTNTDDDSLVTPSANAPATVFVVGLDDFNLQLLRRVEGADGYRFKQLLDRSEIVTAERFDMPALLAKARAILRDSPEPPRAIVGYWDFPTTLMMPILRRELNLRGPALESVLRCEHKYWSRLIQKDVAPAHVPRFTLVDPFEAGAADRIELRYPYWIKPVKAHSSRLGFIVRNRRQLERSLAKIREGIAYFGAPFDHIMSHAELPEHVARVGGSCCIAEEMISAGRQCTLEGYVFDGEVRVYGIVGSIRGRNRSSFERYQYPYLPPEPAQTRMREVTAAVISATGLTDSPFNVEFFYSKENDALYLLEINARVSKSHSPLFEKVEGASNHQVMLEVALGQKPHYPTGRGRHEVAAKFMLRHYGEDDDAVVAAAPDAERARALERQFPGTEIQIHAHAGMRLGDIHQQDSYSYELAEIFIGAQSYRQLMDHYRRCAEALPFSISRERRQARIAG